MLTITDGPRADRLARSRKAATVGPLQLVPSVSLNARGRRGWRSRPLPAASWTMSLDVTLTPGARLAVELGGPGRRIVLSRSTGGGDSLNAGGQVQALGAAPGWPDRGGSRHLEVTGGRHPTLSIDGRPLPAGAGTTPRPRPGRVTVRIDHGRAAVRALLISATADRASLLLHRLAELHARLAPGSLLLGADRADRLRYRSTWTSGFWPGALWQAAAIAPAGGMFARWALQATVAHFGLERSATHDVGFMYGQSSLAAWRALCRGSHRARARAVCPRLAGSVLTAARELLALARTNPGSGTIPTNTASPLGETIVDSMMNLGILSWAGRFTHQRAFTRLALHQAHVVGSLLVRPDGSTMQAVHFDRSTGQIAFLGTHQGLSNSSTWARGQGWALYGFAQLASDLRNPGLLAVAQKLAQYVAGRLPQGGVPPWDYDARPGAPVDVSAGAITAAGMLRLAQACGRLPGRCPDPGQWTTLAREMLGAVLAHAAARPPLGFLSGQVLDGRRRLSVNGAELIFGLDYALEAVRMARG